MVQTPTEWKPQFKVNTIDSTGNGEDQQNPVVVGLSNGNFLVVWQSDAVDSASQDTDIKGQIYDYLGQPVGSEFRLNTGNFFDDQIMPEIAATNDGGFVVVFQDDVSGAGTFNILARRFDANGLSVHFATVASSVDEETAPSVAVFGDNSYLVTYEDDASGSSNINGVIVSSGGVVGSEILIATDSDQEQSPTMATLSNGNIVVVNRDQNGGNASDGAIEIRILDSSGAVVAGYGAFITSGTGVNTEPHVAALDGGGFVVTWTSPTIDGNSDGIAAAIYDNAGIEVVAPFQVNNNTAGSQNEPRVAGLEDGGFVIIWDDDAGDLIRGQRFDETGAEVGNQFSMDRQSEAAPDIAGLRDGRFVITFERIASGNSDIFAQIWDPRESTINGEPFSSNVIAGRSDGSTINGGLAADLLSGVNADDTVNGGAGADTLLGGGGDDLLIGETSSGLAGADMLDGQGGNDTLFGGYLNDTLIGGTGNDELRGEAGDDSLNGGGGMDTLIGREGNDNLDGGVADDRLFGGSGDDTLNGNNGEDHVSGQAGNDVVNGGAGADRIWGKDGDDTLDGDGGADLIRGGQGNDLIVGGTGDDTLEGIADNDTIAGEGGHDMLFGGTGDDFILGGAGNDYIEGNGGNDLIAGGDFSNANGEDTLIGGGGDDTLLGMNQDDTLTGNSGDDLFQFAMGEDNDTITDFVAGGVEDSIELFGFGTDYDTFNEVLDVATQVGSNVVIDFGGGDTITLLGVDKNDLSAADFIFS
ncbi:calcium-binding protein [Hyphococcus sp.]|uniref:calcium-binding protein n=1 Tax=Hyphococcus sp. TaxID=2038636 RepID=UPI002082F6B1|nr:MAG: hypothetical protein DHS20C04_30980 [Marinicaulis sp.]